MKTDRASSYRQWDLSLEDALRHEAIAGEAPLREGARAGAERFAGGLGRSGSFEEI
jgi:enoyl-CoA hydratase